MFDNYKNYKNLGEYDNYPEDDFRFKDPIQYDDVKLKQMSCAHLPEDRQTFISSNGNEQIRCKACGMWDSDTVERAYE